jgi:ABC-type glutathione transport system ATPase component
VLLSVCSLTKEYTFHSPFSKSVIVRAADNVNFDIDEGSVTALIGASGSGKSTLSRCLAGVERPTHGAIQYRGTAVSQMSKQQIREYRRNVQLVFPDAAGTINPRFTAASAVAEPLRVAESGDQEERRQRAIYWMDQVGLPPAIASRPALELSGGERQRLAIARALVLSPEVIIFDESFSSLDLRVADRLLTLLSRLRASYRFTYLFVGHDLALFTRMCSEVAVMYEGNIVERKSIDNFLSGPAHPYSRELVRSLPGGRQRWLA